MLLATAIFLGPFVASLPVGKARLLVPPLAGVLFLYVFQAVRGCVIVGGVSTGVYFLIRTRCPPYTVTFFVLGVLYFVHAHRIATDYMGWKIGVESVLMVLSGKYISLAYDVADGRQLVAGEQLSAKPHEHTARSKLCVQAM